MGRDKDEIAIIGTGCRFPGDVDSPSKLWDLLCHPKYLSREVPSLKGYYHPDGHFHGHSNVKKAYLLGDEDVHRRFDAGFFGVKPAEANVFDPQSRLLLETVYEALEASGLTMERLRGSDTAVYAGQMVGDYELLMYQDHEMLGTYHVSGTSRTMLSNRISYFFDWHGPSMTIDTACSSSLVALHQAVQQLRSGQSKVAVAAGSNLILDSGTFIAMSNLNMLSPDGESRMWDASANGYARGEGVAAMILKRRVDAEADGDHIECIIRETAFNQDGRTFGPTVPSATAQAQLIRDCYDRAGLDLTKPQNRPHFFEAHGTGTPAGDPIEAEAISRAFFPSSVDTQSSAAPLIVGSIKTLVGHTEGTAGLAGVIKASLAIQNRSIPPNLHFNNLNPQVKPYYSNLRIPQQLTPWPSNDGIRRASVNSFGIGGANAHAILESYDKPKTAVEQPPLYIPFTFSAYTDISLKQYLRQFLDYVADESVVKDLRSVAFTLNSHRTRLPVATSVAAASSRDLMEKITSILQASTDSLENRVGVRLTGKGTIAGKPKILGVFTGQGAQWARMGLDLVSKSTSASEIINRLQKRLEDLPEDQRPSWSLLGELQKGEDSRVMTAEISQPLCTAVQIVQVDLLRSAGIEFACVVGHSSGEIAAAYAAGLISAEDAICIAYYRGQFSKLSKGIESKQGSMMAVGTSQEDAQDLLDYPEFQGRVSIGAVNSATSVTLTGDADGIEEAKVVFDDEKKFCRVLKVDKAYHSHHMVPCSESYFDALEALNIQIKPTTDTVWFSSVSGRRVTDVNSLKGSYWTQNMVQPVLFWQALNAACASMEEFDFAFELGPHPALKSVAMETLQSQLSVKVPYVGLFNRGRPAIQSLSEALGLAWSHLGKGAVNLQQFEEYTSGLPSPQLVKGLPNYAWDHSNEYWHETRHAQAIRLRKDPVHELLGHLTPDSTEEEHRWRHIYKLSEMPWMSGHRLQNLVVLPATGSLVSAMESSLMVAKDSPVRMIEILDAEFWSALVFETEDAAIETLFSLSGISRPTDALIEASFKFYATSGKGTDPLELKSSGRVRIHLGTPSLAVLPPRRPQEPNLTPVTAEKAYKMLVDLEYGYTGNFQTLDKLERKLGAVTGTAGPADPTDLILHPGTLDVVLQSTFLTYAHPEEKAKQFMHIPRRIRRLAINPLLCSRETQGQAAIAFDTRQSMPLPHLNLRCEIEAYPHDMDHCMIQVQGLECVPLSRITENDDREVFSQVIWDSMEPSFKPTLQISGLIPPEFKVMHQLAKSYINHLDQNISPDHPCRTEGPVKDLLRLATSEDSKGLHSTEMTGSAVQSIDHGVLSAIGTHLGSLADGHMSVKDIMRGITGLGDWCSKSLVSSTLIDCLGSVLKQICHRHPHMDILEIGTEMGVVSPVTLRQSELRFASLTAIFPGGSSDSHEDFNEKDERDVVWIPLDKEQSLSDQEYGKKSFDLIIATLFLQSSSGATQKLQEIRKLLNPGGYLVVFNLDPSVDPYLSIVHNILTHYWDTIHDKEFPSAIPAWNSLLTDAGFSELAHNTFRSEPRVALSMFITQAVDERVSFLRNPLTVSPPENTGLLAPEVIIVSQSPSVLASHLAVLLKPFSGHIAILDSINDILSFELCPNTSILSLLDSDSSLFESLDETKWAVIKKLMLQGGPLIWVTRGRISENPIANMIQGTLRGAARDNPSLDYILLDFEDAETMTASAIAECFVTHSAKRTWKHAEDVLATTETEIAWKKSGEVLIPRLVMDKRMNMRYNSNNREMIDCIQAENHILRLQSNPPVWKLEKDENFAHRPRMNISCMRTTHSILSPIRVTDIDYMFLHLTNNEHGKTYLTLSNESSNTLSLKEELTVPVQLSNTSEPLFIRHTAVHLLVSFILGQFYEGDVLLIHEASLDFETIISQQAAIKGIKVIFTTTSKVQYPQQTGQRHIIHHEISQYDLRQLLDEDITAFVNMEMPYGSEGKGEQICSLLPPYCKKFGIKDLFDTKAGMPKPSRILKLRQHFETAISSAIISSETSREGDTDVPTTDLSACPLSNSQEPLSIIRWGAEKEIPVNVKPVTAQVSFAADKTYWLVGLTGKLGLSLCDWMVGRGARNFVMTSRRPNIDTAWLRGMSDQGVQISVTTCDILHKSSVQTLYAQICATMPPVAGVVSGAMILNDVNFEDMTFEQFSKVTGPKVQGSINLNDLFQDDVLDFFIFFSSASCVIGNHGQANYGAANTFMASLAEQRRQKGLAGSVIHIGPILGIGYIAKAGDVPIVAPLTLQTGGFSTLTERDFHQLFGEAVLVGKAPQGSPANIVSGIRTIDKAGANPPIWESWASMGHFVRGRAKGSDNEENNQQSARPLGERVHGCKTYEGIYEMIFESFSKQLESFFQIDTTKLSKQELGVMSFDQMGIDSLTAVEIRGWFLKALDINLPVLKILNGGTVGDIVGTAAEKIFSARGPAVEVPSYSDTEPPASTSNDSTEETLEYDSHSSVGVDHDLQILRSVPVSFTQDRFYPAGLFLEDKIGLNHTTWARFSKPIDGKRLRRAVKDLTQQHEVLRTAFFDVDGVRMQHILASSAIHLEEMEVKDQEEVKKIGMHIQATHVYNVGIGETLRLILCICESKEAFLIFGAHPLVLDAMSVVTFVKWLSYYYDHPGLSRRVKQFADASNERTVEFKASKLEHQMEFWSKEFQTPPPPLPVMTVATLPERPVLKNYHNVVGECQVSLQTKSKISQVCREARATPMHFYFAVLRCLLLRYTVGGEDVTIAVAEGGRGIDGKDMDVLGPLYNLALVRLVNERSSSFKDILQVTRAKTLAALANAQAPYVEVVKRFKLQETAVHSPFFQVFVDFRVGQQSTMQWGEHNTVSMVEFHLNVPYDLYLDTIDDLEGNCTHCLFLRDDLYDQKGADELASSFSQLIEAFANNPEMTVLEPNLAKD